MNLEAGELIELDNNEQYIVMDTMNYNNSNYIFLITRTSPISIKIAEEKIKDNSINLEMVENSNLIEKLIKVLSK